MPCCAASHCCNREIGVRLFRFPKDAKRKDIWRIFCERGEWQPTKNHKLCEVHFDEEQFESEALTNRGNRKLKPAAIPTLYVEQPAVDTQMVRQLRRIKEKCPKDPSTTPKMPRGRKPKITSETEVKSSPDSPNSGKRNVFVLMLPSGPNNKKMGIVIKGPKDLAKIKQMYGDRPFPPIKHLKIKTNKFNQLNKQVCPKKLKLSDLTDELNLGNFNNGQFTPTTKVQRSVYERKLRLLMAKNTILQKKLAKSNLQMYVQSKNLKKFLNKDQLDVLSAKNKRRERWTDETIEKCVQLRIACGSKGYRHLKRMGFPLPNGKDLKRTAAKPSIEVREMNVECSVDITIEDGGEYIVPG